MVITYRLFCLLVLGCDNVSLVGNGFCNDEANNADCNYDGGECCFATANTDYCSDCACHLLETCGYHSMVENGFCDDNTNIAGCYDGGDCCGYNINSEHCAECICYLQETCLAGVHPLVGDGFCNYETNNFDCDYDGGDCCVNINTDYCSGCNCRGGGIITSPGFPYNYDINLDLTWLIQVKIEQKIEINFLFFEVGFWNCE